MFRRFLRWFKSKFKKPSKPDWGNPPEVVDVIIPVGEKDEIDDGDTRNPDFSYIWSFLELDEDRLDQINDICQVILSYRSKYEKVSSIVGCPWWYIAALHYRESSLDFRGVLHNGQRIIGTGKKTTWVPKGRGPFNSWEESAIDALKIKKYHQKTSWTMEECISRAERFNGLGYRRRGEYSPYILAGTNFHDETGKYVSDGKYKKDAIEKQLGVCSIWLGLQNKGVKLGD